MRTDPVVIVICDGNNCFGTKTVKRQLLIDCGWQRGGLDDWVKRRLEEEGWAIEKEKELCKDCHVGAIKL